MKRPDDSLTNKDMGRMADTLDELMPRVLPGVWRQVEHHLNARLYASRDGLRVIASIELHEDSGRSSAWLHVSLSRNDRVPSYFDCGRVKALFVGRDRKAFQVFPPESEHVNIHPHVLHLWSPIGFDPVGDLRDQNGVI